jgi:nucleotide-binding universal stress UspA family protein
MILLVVDDAPEVLEAVSVSFGLQWRDTVSSGASTNEERLEEVVADRRAYLEEQARALTGLPVTVRVEPLRWPVYHRSEEVAAGLARVARDCGADTVVVASKRASGLLGLLPGDTARGVLRASPCPVLVVRPEWACSGPLDAQALEARSPGAVDCRRSRPADGGGEMVGPCSLPPM